MLIYEYMPNKSLDSFIFGIKREMLDWSKRYEIIVGIAREILYLHKDSRLRFIHRDLKISYVLLDKEMNPKISDFGLARIFGGNEIQANTKKVVGIVGYMSPEYAMQGVFSIKSDVFSFGILLLEIISGKKNNEYFNGDPSMNLIGHKEDRVLEAVDSALGDSYPPHEISRCIQVGLLSMFPPTWLFFLLFPFYASAVTSNLSSTDTLTPTESITDGQIIVSAASIFALGFFSPGASNQRYVGIWYHKVPNTAVIWVANRNNPLNKSSGVLSLAQDGNLVISSDTDQSHPLWSTNVSMNSNTTILKLLDSGNLVLYSSSNRNTVLWQSFDHPTHMWLPTMKLGMDRRTGLNRVLTSWKSKDDPGLGIYSFKIDPRGSPQLFLYNGSDRLWRAGPWNGQRWSGVVLSNVISYDFINTTNELYAIYDIYNSSISGISSTVLLDDSGAIQQMTVERNRGWSTFYLAPNDTCDYYGHCGAYGGCNTDNTPECSCLQGFQPMFATKWSNGGCVRKRSLGCDTGDGFLKLEGVKLPDTSTFLVDRNLSLKDCEQGCLKNCSCTAYAPADITGEGSGCVAWFGNLMDIRYFSDGGGDYFYLRVDAMELGSYIQIH
ncbi:hypothetical protein NE237_000294 [Protea cynaroides]|uniref:Non-specific serine/threonine protein kinase n=1 Tax=Protea cynaroides TaxID=273540 RepID=A0A9Q0KQZ0_9MAGN|nr:hypothetical protein NE237_000294 [Protea cynaroides]